jgi:hypothetical protein
MAGSATPNFDMGVQFSPKAADKGICHKNINDIGPEVPPQVLPLLDIDLND